MSESAFLIAARALDVLRMQGEQPLPEGVARLFGDATREFVDRGHASPGRVCQFGARHRLEER